MLSKVYVANPRLEAGRATCARPTRQSVGAGGRDGRTGGHLHPVAYNADRATPCPPAPVAEPVPRPLQRRRDSGRDRAGRKRRAGRAGAAVAAGAGRAARRDLGLHRRRPRQHDPEPRPGNEERLQIQLDATRDREHFGDVTRTDILQAEARHAGASPTGSRPKGRSPSSCADYRRLSASRAGSALPPASGRAAGQPRRGAGPGRRRPGGGRRPGSTWRRPATRSPWRWPR